MEMSLKSRLQGNCKDKSGLGSRVSAACKHQGNQPFTVLKISWKSKHDPNLANFQKKIQNIQISLIWGLVAADERVPSLKMNK